MEINIQTLMNDSGVKFGTSGARGLVADMNDLVCFAYTTAFLHHAKSLIPKNVNFTSDLSDQRERVDTHGAEAPLKSSLAGESGKKFDRVAVGYDLRESSPRIAKAVGRAIEQFGLVPVDCGAVPSPTLALYGLTEKIPSIMVTGSHIPEDRNGIKFNLPSGEILKADEAAIRSRTVQLSDELFDSDGMFQSNLPPVSFRSDAGAAPKGYIDRFLQAFPNSLLTGCRIGLYEHSSVARDLLFDLYTRLGASVTRLGRSDRFVAVDTEAVRDEDLFLARNWASGNDLPKGVTGTPENPPFDVIVSTDGDGDRPLLFDEHGRWIRGDVAGILTARFLLADYVVTPISSSTALERSGWFSRIARTKIGSPYVVEAMQNAVEQGFKRVVGYEANGGFLTANTMLIDEEDSPRPLTALPTRDAAIVHIAALCHAKSTGVPLSALEQYMPRRIVMSDRLQNFPSDLARQKLEELSEGGNDTIKLVFAKFGELENVDRTDGIRMTFGDGDVVHLRPSGNAPELRCYTEADTREQAASLLYRTMTILDSWRRRSQHDTYPYKQ